MAEIVEYRVAKTHDEMSQLQQLGVLSGHQVKEITRRRTEFEYKLRRHNRTKLEYLKYIQFEINFLQSLDTYRKALIKDYKENKDIEKDRTSRQLNFLKAKQLGRIVHKRAIHVSALFRWLCIRHQFDERLWLAYIEFAHSRHWHSRVSALYWRMLRVNGKKESLWLKAAEYERKYNKSYDSCRGLLLRSLRHHPDSVLLWSEYFKMEMQFVDLLDRRRKVLLGQQSISTEPLKFYLQDDEDIRGDNDDVEKDEGMDDDQMDDDNEQRPIEILSESEDKILRGGVAYIVFEQGSQALRPKPQATKNEQEKSEKKLKQFVENCLKTVKELKKSNPSCFTEIFHKIVCEP